MAPAVSATEVVIATLAEAGEETMEAAAAEKRPVSERAPGQALGSTRGPFPWCCEAKAAKCQQIPRCECNK